MVIANMKTWWCYHLAPNSVVPNYSLAELIAWLYTLLVLLRQWLELLYCMSGVSRVFLFQTVLFPGWMTPELPRPSSTLQKWWSSVSWRSDKKFAYRGIKSQPWFQMGFHLLNKTTGAVYGFYYVNMRAANQTQSDKLVESETVRAPKIQHLFVPWSWWWFCHK